MNDGKPMKFTAGQEITINIELSPAEYAMFREWSAMVPTLYFLDICVVGVTKLTEDSAKNNPRKAQLIAHLQNLDRPHNGFSYLFALMEKVSDSRGKLTLEELRHQILIDMSALKGFFKSAEIFESDNFVTSFLENLMGEPIENKRPEYLSFLKLLNNHFNLLNPVSPEQRLVVARAIIQEANSLNICIQHPILCIALACLYGNPCAKKLMKFKQDPNKFDAENALADILLISRFAIFKLEIEHYGREGNRYVRADFITDDNGLTKLVEHFKPRSVIHKDKIDGRESQITITVELEKLLTDITNDDYSVISELLLSTNHIENDH